MFEKGNELIKVDTSSFQNKIDLRFFFLLLNDVSCVKIIDKFSSTLVQFFCFFFFFCQIVTQRIQLPLIRRRRIRSHENARTCTSRWPVLSLTSCVLTPSEQRCQCTSSGCTTCAARRRRYEKSGRKEDRIKVVNVGPIVRTNRSRQPDPCTVATGCTGARAGSSSVPHCSLATPSMRSRFKYPGNVFPVLHDDIPIPPYSLFVSFESFLFRTIRNGGVYTFSLKSLTTLFVP